LGIEELHDPVAVQGFAAGLVEGVAQFVAARVDSRAKPLHGFGFELLE